jgi:hypothetical protein
LAIVRKHRLADFFHPDFVFKVIRIERIDPSFCGFGLRIGCSTWTNPISPYLFSHPASLLPLPSNAAPQRGDN